MGSRRELAAPIVLTTSALLVGAASCTASDAGGEPVACPESPAPETIPSDGEPCSVPQQSCEVACGPGTYGGSLPNAQCVDGRWRRAIGSCNPPCLFGGYGCDSGAPRDAAADADADADGTEDLDVGDANLEAEADVSDGDTD